jgi:GTP-binding protein
MKFVDHVEIYVKAGDGGPGATSFRREKFVPMGGPDGGDGGHGGDVIFRSTRNLQTLMDLDMKRRHKAKNGSPGGVKKCYGTKGSHCEILVPCGTIIFNQDGTILADLQKEGDEVIAAKGGKGGLGNARFSTSVNQAPRYAQPGLPGEEKNLTVELRLLAEVGLVGLPNAGKSTLLKALTRANPKIADYPFTTLYPNLGVLKFSDREIVIADIPGLIEGASEGHGLGAEFLRHVERTSVLIHLVAVTPNDPEQCWNDYTTVRQELHKNQHDLLAKPTIVILSKEDTIPEADKPVFEEVFTQQNVHPLWISSLMYTGIPDLISQLVILYDAEKQHE